MEGVNAEGLGGGQGTWQGTASVFLTALLRSNSHSTQLTRAMAPSIFIVVLLLLLSP